MAVAEPPRRSLRLALTEVSFNEETHHETPNKTASPDELVIIQRGPRRKPITWSPVESERQVEKSKDTTPVDKLIRKKPGLNPKLRRRLVWSPSKNSASLGKVIAMKLRTLPRLDQEFNENKK